MTYSRDFSTYATGQSPSDWTCQWQVPTSWNVVESEDSKCGGQELLVDRYTNQVHAFSPDDVGEVTDVDMLGFFEVHEWDYRTFGFVARGSGTPGQNDECGYLLRINTARSLPSRQPPGLCLGYVTNGGVMDHMPLYAFPVQQDTKYWVRFNVVTEGANARLRAKIWVFGDAEPGVWHQDKLDYGEKYPSGWVGIHAQKSGGSFDWFGVATCGNSVELPLCASSSSSSSRSSSSSSSSSKSSSSSSSKSSSSSTISLEKMSVTAGIRVPTVSFGMRVPSVTAEIRQPSALHVAFGLRVPSVTAEIRRPSVTVNIS